MLFGIRKGSRSVACCDAWLHASHGGAAAENSVEELTAYPQRHYTGPSPEPSTTLSSHTDDGAIGVATTVSRLFWANQVEMEAALALVPMDGKAHGFDVILAADVIYEVSYPVAA